MPARPRTGPLLRPRAFDGRGLALAWLSLAALVLLAPRPAAAQEWTYTARAGDSLWLLAQEYLRSMRHWGDFRALNDVPDPRRMQPGTRVRFPVAWLRVQPAPVVVDALSGDTRVADAGGELVPASAGRELAAGARVVTGHDGSAVLRFADGSTMLVRPGSEVVMDELGIYGRGGMVDTRARLQHGAVETQVPSGGASRMEILTPSASALVRGTRFRVSSAEAVTRSEVVDGRVRVASPSGAVELPAATGTRVRAGEKPEPPRPLLPAPDLAPVATLFERRQLRIGWQAVAGAVGYRAQIASTGAIPVLLLDAAVPTARLELPDLADGHYQLRVRAVDEAGLEGLESRRDFELNARPEPPATVEPRPGQTVRSTRPPLRWTQPRDAAAYRVQLAAAAGFGAPVLARTLSGQTQLQPDAELAPGAYRWRVATVDGRGEQGPWGDVQAFTVRPAPPAPGADAPQVAEDGVFLRWQAGQPGQRYEVQFAASEDFATDARSESSDEPQLVIPVPEQDLWFRVRVVDSDGYRGPYGTPQRIEAPRDHPWWLLLVLPLLILVP